MCKRVPQTEAQRSLRNIENVWRKKKTRETASGLPRKES